MNSFVPYCFTLRSQIHLYHFQTTSYSEHKALDLFYDELLDHVDNLTETYQGRYGRIETGGYKESVSDYNDHKEVIKTIEEFVKTTEKMKKTIKDDDSDLQNILDEMIGLGNKTLYLLTLK